MYAKRINPYPEISKIITTISQNLSEDQREARYLAVRLPLTDGVFSTTFHKGKPEPYSIVEIGSTKEGGHCDIFFKNKTGEGVIMGATTGRYGCLPPIINALVEQLKKSEIMKKAIISSSSSTSAKPSRYLANLFEQFKPSQKSKPMLRSNKAGNVIMA